MRHSPDRRAFVRRSATLAGAALLPPWAMEPWWHARPRRTDWVIRGAMVYDGSGGPAFEADIAITGDRIEAVGPGLPGGAQELDARDLGLAPGFIDTHSHSDLVLLVDPHAQSKVRQGVTTEIAGQDGSSVGPWGEQRYQETRESYRARYGIEIGFRDVGGFFRQLEAQPAAVNLASMVGHGTLHTYGVAGSSRPATDAERRRMAGLVAEAARAGACGVSSGLEYLPGAFADLDELAAVAAPFRGTGLPYATHMRNEDDRLLAAIEEALNVGRRAGVAVHLSHLKAQGQRNWWKAGVVLEMIDAARVGGLDVTFDVYPYVAYSTGLSNMFPVWAREGGTPALLRRLSQPATAPRVEAEVRDKVDQLGSWDAVQITNTGAESLAWARGRRLGQLAAERGIEPYALLLQLTREDQNRAGMIGFGMSEENVGRFLAHPRAIVCSDGSALTVEGPLARGSPHPRNYGTFPRVLALYCRDRNELSYEAAIHKMTAAPAARMRLGDRGRIAPGMYADLVVFDPARVADRATFENPHQYPVGIPHVMVNGTWVLRDGEHTGARPGRVVRPV